MQLVSAGVIACVCVVHVFLMARWFWCGYTYQIWKSCLLWSLSVKVWKEAWQRWLQPCFIVSPLISLTADQVLGFCISEGPYLLLKDVCSYMYSVLQAWLQKSLKSSVPLSSISSLHLHFIQTHWSRQISRRICKSSRCSILETSIVASLQYH